MDTQRNNLFHRGHYNKIAALLGRVGAKHNVLDGYGSNYELWNKLVVAFGDMFEEDYPEREDDGGYHFQREKFNDAVVRHYAETIHSGS